LRVFCSYGNNTAYYMWLILEVHALAWQVVVVVIPRGLVSG
jgi:hypothetical protein